MCLFLPDSKLSHTSPADDPEIQRMIVKSKSENCGEIWTLGIDGNTEELTQNS